MNNPHIPSNSILKDEEYNLHMKVDKNYNFQIHYDKLSKFISESTIDNELKVHISEALIKVCISAEAAAYKEGLKESIKFISKRENDFRKAFERFLAEYRMDRIADTHDFLENDHEYKKIHSDKIEKENALQAVIKDTNMSMALLDYISAVEILIDNVKTMFYEHGFQDYATIHRAMKEGLDGIPLRTLIELDIE